MFTPALIAERNSHPYLTYDMIRDIPKGFRSTLQAISNFTVEPSLDSQSIFTGNGTALYSAMMGSQVLNFSERDSQAIPAFELANYERLGEKPMITIGVSHSGITKSTLDALSKVKSNGSKTIGVTHFSGRPISKIVDSTIVIGDSPDKSRCHTKAYTNSAAAVFALSLKFAQPSSPELQNVKNEFETNLANEIESTISRTEQQAKKAAIEFRNVSKIFFAGAGPNFITAREAALKIKEASYLAAEGME